MVPKMPMMPLLRNMNHEPHVLRGSLPPSGSFQFLSRAQKTQLMGQQSEWDLQKLTVPLLLPSDSFLFVLISSGLIEV